MSPPRVLSLATLLETNRWSKKPATSAFFMKRIVEGQIIKLREKKYFFVERIVEGKIVKFRGKHLGHVEVGAEEEREVAEGGRGLLEP